MEENPYEGRVRQWRLKAEECRTVGDQMCDPQARASFHQMAESYDHLADSWERRSTPAGSAKKPEAG
jgi:hypothetical protein